MADLQQRGVIMIGNGTELGGCERKQKGGGARLAHDRNPGPRVRETEPAGVHKAALRHVDDDNEVGLKDIKLKGLDGRGLRITQIYAIRSNEYIIYKAGEVMVHFSDDPNEELKQRKLILPLGRARAELNYLSQGLRCSEVCAHHLANALQLALEGDLDGAKKILSEARSIVVAKRNARGRFQYLTWSYAIAAIVIVSLFFARWYWPANVLLAAQGGLVGVAFSVALAIRKRAVALDTEPLANVTDGVLRLLIGVISAGVLMCLVKFHIVSRLTSDASNIAFSIGPTTLEPQMALVIGFIGGFLERLVPDLLEKMNPYGNGSANNAPTGSSR
jgi:hypothetical protein